MIEGTHVDPVAALVTLVALVVERNGAHHLADANLGVPVNEIIAVSFSSPLDLQHFKTLLRSLSLSFHCL